MRELKNLIRKKDIIAKLTKKHGKNFRTKLAAAKPKKIVKIAKNSKDGSTKKSNKPDHSSKASSLVITPAITPDDRSVEAKFMNNTLFSIYSEKHK